MESGSQSDPIIWAAAARVSGLAVILHHPVWSANHRMSSSSQQETITARGHCTEVWELHSSTDQVWLWAALKSQLMFLYMCMRVWLHTQTYIQPAVAQHSQADDLGHLSGDGPKEKLNSFNFGEAVNSQLISACVFISWPSIPQFTWFGTHQWF